MRPKPELLTRAERLDELASILAAGLLRLEHKHAAPPNKNSDDLVAAGLECSSRSRLTVTPTCESS